MNNFYEGLEYPFRLHLEIDMQNPLRRDEGGQNNGGNYDEPSISVKGQNTQVEFEDTSCGDFGTRLHLGFCHSDGDLAGGDDPWTSNWGTMEPEFNSDGMDPDYRDAVVDALWDVYCALERLANLVPGLDASPCVDGWEAKK